MAPLSARDGVSDREDRVKLFAESLRGDAAGDLQIQEIVRTSARTRTGIDEFTTRVIAVGRDQRLFPTVGYLMPASWVRCRNFITAVTRGHDPRAATRRDPKDDYIGIPALDIVPRDFIIHAELHALWQASSVEALTIEASEARAMLDSVLNLRAAEGDVLELGQQVHLRPTWLVELLKPLADHRLGEASNERRRRVLESGVPANTLDSFVREGTAPLSLIRALWATELADVSFLSRPWWCALFCLPLLEVNRHLVAPLLSLQREEL